MQFNWAIQVLNIGTKRVLTGNKARGISLITSDDWDFYFFMSCSSGWKVVTHSDSDLVGGIRRLLRRRLLMVSLSVSGLVSLFRF
jgi:hypothetical protein